MLHLRCCNAAEILWHFAQQCRAQAGTSRSRSASRQCQEVMLKARMLLGPGGQVLRRHHHAAEGIEAAEIGEAALLAGVRGGDHAGDEDELEHAPSECRRPRQAP